MGPLINMDNKTFLESVSKKCAMSATEVQACVDSFVKLLVEAAEANDSVALPGFGTFEPRKRVERISLHPVSGKRLLIPPKIVLGFKPSAILKGKLNRDKKS